MMEGLWGFLNVLKAVAIFLALGALVSFIFYSLQRRDLFGGYIGGLVVGFIGAIIGGYLLDYLFYNISVILLEFLSRGIGVNVIAGFIGAYVALCVMNKLNHNKERKKY
jgi:uncharacterized membrane protein YeaQ/YmgE (transglycosylase-associated protein family)